MYGPIFSFHSLHPAMVSRGWLVNWVLRWLTNIDQYKPIVTNMGMGQNLYIIINFSGMNIHKSDLFWRSLYSAYGFCHRMNHYFWSNFRWTFPMTFLAMAQDISRLNIRGMRMRDGPKGMTCSLTKWTKWQALDGDGAPFCWYHDGDSSSVHGVNTP